MTESTGFPEPDSPGPAAAAPAPAPEPEPAREPKPEPEIPFGTPGWLAELLADYHKRLVDLEG